MKYFNQVQNLEDRELSYVEEVTGASPGAAPTVVTDGVDCTGYASVFVRLTCDQATATSVTVAIIPWYWARTQVGVSPAVDTDAWLPGEPITLDALDDAAESGQVKHISCAEGDRLYLQVVPSGSGLAWANIEAFAALSRTEVMTAYTLGSSTSGGGGTSSASSGYDATADAIRMINVNPGQNQTVENVIVDTTTAVAVTAYAPSSAGLPLLPNKDITAQLFINGGVKTGPSNMTVTVTIEATNDLDDGGTIRWSDVTKAVYELTTNTNDNASFTSVGNVDEDYELDMSNINKKRWRLKYVWTDTPDSTNGEIICVTRTKQI